MPEAVLERLTARAAGARRRPRRARPARPASRCWLALGAGGAVLLAPPARRAAQMAGRRRARRPNPVGADENWLVRNIVCQCGTCRHNLLECATENCGHAIAGSHRDPAAARPGADARPGHRVLHQEVRRPGGAGGADRQGLQPAGVAVAVQRSAAVAAGGLGYAAYRLAKRPAPPPRPPTPAEPVRSPTRSLPTSSMTSSATLTEPRPERHRGSDERQDRGASLTARRTAAPRARRRVPTLGLGRGGAALGLAYGVVRRADALRAAAGDAGARRDDAGAVGGARCGG